MKITLLFAFLGIGCAACVAQPEVTTPAPNDGIAAVPEGKKGTFKFTLKNVKPSLMAYWLDPANHEAPEGFRKPMRLVPQRKNEQEAAFERPPGVDRLVAVDPQNALLVFGTAQGANSLAQVVNFLDRPLRQVEIEAKFVNIESKDLGTLIPQFTPINTLGTNRIWRIPDGLTFTETLDSLTKKGKAKVLSSPRILAVNNLTAEVSQTASEQVKLRTDDEKSNALNLPEGMTLSLEESRSLNVTPTINNDATVTLLALIGEDVKLKNPADSNGALVLRKEEGPQVIVNVRDGETVAIEVHSKQGSTPTSQTTLVLLTPRIVRRAGD